MVTVLCSVCEQAAHFAYDINKTINLGIICYGKLVQMCKGQQSICVKIKDTGTEMTEIFFSPGNSFDE